VQEFKLPEWLKEIYKRTFGENYIKSIFSLFKPSWKYYLRVNTVKTNTRELLKKLEEEGITAKEDSLFEDAIYIEGYETFEPILLDKLVIAKLDAAESVSQGADLFKPGCIRILNAEKEDHVSVVTQNFIVAAEGKLVVSKNDFNKIKKGIVVKNEKPKFKLPSIRSLKSYNEGLIYSQTFPSILTVHELEPKEEETILDMCASPGGKLSHIIALTKNKAKIIAVDKTNSKINRIKETLNLLGLPLPLLIKSDARNLDKILGKEFADKILLDPSCSDLGLRPRLTFDLFKKDPKIYSKLQKSLIKKAYEYLKKGGILVYSVCTVSFEETYEIFDFAINELKMYPLELKYKVASYGNKFINIFDPYNDDTVGYAIFKLMK